jgi:glycosyltransferase involved in cell wall biosynthesis
MTAKPRLAIVVSHPIQHFVHFYRAVALQPEIELKVFFCSKIGIESYHDWEMNTEIKWSGDLISDYEHEFLPESESITNTSFRSINNPSIYGALNKFNPQAVLIYGYAQITQLRVLAWCRTHGVPSLMAGDGNLMSARTKFRDLARSFVLRLLLSQVSGFLTAGDQNEEMLGELGIPRERMYRVPFSIDEKTYIEHRYHRDAERQKIRLKHSIPEDAFVLLFVGKISARKRPMDLVAAWQTAIQKMDRASRLFLLFCGDGPEFAPVSSAAIEAGADAAFAGFVNLDQLPAYYCAADVLIHPSEHDPHPLVCSEAACIGLPMILSDKVGAVGPTDIAREGKNALIYPCRDTNELAKAILVVLNDPVRYRAMADASLEAFNDCNMKTSVRGLLKAVRETLLKRAPIS